MTERRQTRRYHQWLPVTIDGLERGLAVTHNASSTGALLVTATRVDVGTEIALKFQMPPDGREELAVRGRVVRSGANGQDPDGLWPFSLAVAFDETAGALDELLTALAATEESISTPAPASVASGGSPSSAAR